ncbi:hypothetical protein [Microbacterium sp. A93]|uniref:hypothetical protein n=1 Tax=Microbacterium sp. A93 TaxID=3450716 RepID=UPI003F420D55
MRVAFTPRRTAESRAGRRAAVAGLLGAVLLATAGCVPAGQPAADTPSTGRPGVLQAPEDPGAAEPTGWSLRAPDGGADYYGRFRDGLPASEEFFPMGLWIGSVVEPSQAAHELDLGLNLYVDLTPDSRLDFLAEGEQFALTSWADPRSRGSVLGDEVDMWAGPGTGDWTGNFPGQGEICADPDVGCGHTVQERLHATVDSDRLTYANYGKGVTFWNTDAEASRFVSGPQDVVSVDNYWFTDPYICGPTEGGLLLDEARELTEEECRLPANYGWTIDRVRSLIEPSGAMPVWAFMEVGQPFDVGTEDPPTMPEIRAGIWSSLVHGARGVVYFGHSFAGPCPTFHVLRDCGPDLAAGITAINQEVAGLAPVLNAPWLDDALEISGAADAAVKVHDGDLYVLSTASATRPGRIDFRLDCARDGDAEVLGEGRTVPVSGGAFTDDFEASTSVHLYRLEGNDCGL